MAAAYTMLIPGTAANGCGIRVSYVVIKYLTLSAHAREGYSTQFVCQSVSQSFCHTTITDLEDGSRPRIETSIKILHWTF